MTKGSGPRRFLNLTLTSNIMVLMQRSFVILCSAVSIFGAGLLIYSQTAAFAWDEGFHLLAAQLIAAGKRPYLDFCFPQTPLNAYWNAGWMRIFGDTWRTAHAVAALMTTLAMLLAAGFALARPIAAGWKLAGALTVAALIGLNILVVQFGALGQAYGLGLFLIVAAYRISILAVDRPNALWAGGAGFLSVAAAASTLLTAPVAMVLLVWVLVYNRTGQRWMKLGAFLFGGVAAFLPVIWLFAESPRNVIFNIIDYNFRYRQLNWEGATEHNFDVLTSWIDSPQALMLVLLAIAGIVFVRTKSALDRGRRAELHLCGWIALALGLHISTARPTFERYYLFLVPFLAILSSAGVYWIGSRLSRPDRSWRAAIAIVVLLSLGLARRLYQDADDFAWRDFEPIAAAVNQAAPRGSTVLVDEAIYFITRRAPPSGMELVDSHKLVLEPSVAAALHVVPQAELDRRVLAREFSVVETCGEESHVLKLGLDRLYKNKTEFDDCKVFW